MNVKHIKCPICGNHMNIIEVGVVPLIIDDYPTLFNVSIEPKIKDFLLDNLSYETYMKLINSDHFEYLDEKIFDIFVFDLEDYILEKIELFRE